MRPETNRRILPKAGGKSGLRSTLNKAGAKLQFGPISRHCEWYGDLQAGVNIDVAEYDLERRVLARSLGH